MMSSSISLMTKSRLPLSHPFSASTWVWKSTLFLIEKEENLERSRLCCSLITSFRLETRHSTSSNSLPIPLFYLGARNRAVRHSSIHALHVPQCNIYRRSLWQDHCAQSQQISSICRQVWTLSQAKVLAALAKLPRVYLGVNDSTGLSSDLLTERTTDLTGEWLPRFAVELFSDQLHKLVALVCYRNSPVVPEGRVNCRLRIPYSCSRAGLYNARAASIK